VVVTEAVSLGLLKAPGAMGADIVAAGGPVDRQRAELRRPYVGLFACREQFVRQMPGRLAGETVDADGRRGFVLTLSTREQHIRRDKATSNICTNSGLCALAFTIHMSLLGEAGCGRMALLSHQNARRLRESINEIRGVKIMTPRFFNEFAMRVRRCGRGGGAHGRARRAGRRALCAHRSGPGMDDVLLVAATELTTLSDIEIFRSELREVLS
jgi:glycine dehydrogenase subunit 1